MRNPASFPAGLAASPGGLCADLPFPSVVAASDGHLKQYGVVLPHSAIMRRGKPGFQPGNLFPLVRDRKALQNKLRCPAP
jgi:hypothetical protein